MNLMPYSSATSRPRLSLVTIVMRSGGISIWRKMRGITTLPNGDAAEHEERSVKLYFFFGFLIHDVLVNDANLTVFLIVSYREINVFGVPEPKPL